MVDYNLHNVWQNALAIVVIGLILLGLWAFTMTLTIWIWVGIVVVAGVVIYFGLERLFAWGAGR